MPWKPWGPGGPEEPEGKGKVLLCINSERKQQSLYSLKSHPHYHEPIIVIKEGITSSIRTRGNLETTTIGP